MRTKTLLLAGAALAISLVASQAAPVYSQNVVGYANVPMLSGDTYLLTIPFQIGASNGANEVWPLSGGNPTVPDNSELLVWTGSGYQGYLSDSTSTTLWDDPNTYANVPPPALPVGIAFFLIPGGNVTSTFAGSVAVVINGTKSVSLLSGDTYLVASYVPYAGSVSLGTSTGGGPALNYANGLPDNTELLIWTGSGYTGYLSDSTSTSGWDDPNTYANIPAPTVAVAQGFFLIPGLNFTWTVGLGL